MAQLVSLALQQQWRGRRGRGCTLLVSHGVGVELVVKCRGRGWPGLCRGGLGAVLKRRSVG